MFESIKKWYKDQKRKAKIRKRLPNFTPRGQRLDWKISFDTPGKYDIFTGEFIPTGKEYVSIQQRCPRSGMVEDCVYTFDLKTNKLKKTGAVWR